MRDLSAEQKTLLDRAETRPVFLVDSEITPGHREYLSTGGDVTVGDETYTGADVGVIAVDNWTRAIMKFRPTPDRVSSLLTGDYRRTPATVSLLPIFSFPAFIAQGYVETGYANNGDQQEDPILLLDGVLISASIADTADVTIAHRATVGYWAPRVRITGEWCNHLIQPGRVLEWQGEKYVLEAE